MNAKGVLSFTLVLSLIFVQLNIAENDMQGFQAMAEAKENLLLFEKVNSVRTNVENNVDFLIRETLIEEIKNENTSPESLKSSVARKLFQLFKKIEKTEISDIEIKFFSATGKNFEFKNKRELTQEFIEENSEILILNLNEKVKLVEFTYTGGELKNKLVVGSISAKTFEQIFLIPVGYTQKIEVIG